MKSLAINGPTSVMTKMLQEAEKKFQIQFESWRSRLLDIGNRNPMISTSFNLSRGVLEICHPEPEAVWEELIISGDAGSRSMRFPWKRDLVKPPKVEKASRAGKENPGDQPSEVTTEIRDWNPPLESCLSSTKLRSGDLLTEIGDNALDRRIRTLNGYAGLSLSEQGIHCLFIAFGFVKWFETADSTKEIRSPLMLVPVSFTRDMTGAPWELLEAEDDVIDNLCLRQRFKQDFNLAIPTLPSLDQLEETGSRLAYLDEVRKAISKHGRWEVEDRCCIGRFAFPKIAMWQDLGDNQRSIQENPICRSIGAGLIGDSSGAFGNPSTAPKSSELDSKVGPGEIKAILDCDSSQLEAIAAARNGVSFVLDGPPGTGKSQTIANIIADGISSGKRVLFVSEKVAALEVVKKRLDECGLGDFCLECHSSKANRKAVLDELKRCLEIPIEKYPDSSQKFSELRKVRQTLNDYVKALHIIRKPIGESLYGLMGQIATLKRKGLALKSRISIPDPQSVTIERLESWKQILGDAPRHEGVIANHSSHPWRACGLDSKSLSLEGDIRHFFNAFSELTKSILVSAKSLESADFFPGSEPFPKLAQMLEKLGECLKIPSISKAWFSNPKSVAKAILLYNDLATSIRNLQASIPEYEFEGLKEFPGEVVSLATIHSNPWVGRLAKRLPEDLRDCHQALARYAEALKAIAKTAEELNTSQEELVRELNLPIKAGLPIGSVEKLTTVGKLLAANAPLRESWFEESGSSKIKNDSTMALSELDQSSRLASSVSERISPDLLPKLFTEAGDLAELSSSWNYLKSTGRNIPLGQIEPKLVELRALEEKFELLSDQWAKVSERFYFKNEFLPNLSQFRSVIQAIPCLAGIKAFHGGWVRPESRADLRSKIETAIQDLLETDGIRRSLGDRFSHRAFLPEARNLVQGGKKYESWIGRLLGGFRKFRQEIADLYTTPVPDTKTLLNDLALLSKFHKRIQSIEEVSANSYSLLPPGHKPLELPSWESARDGLAAIEKFSAEFPGAQSIWKEEQILVKPANDDLDVRQTLETLDLVCRNEGSGFIDPKDILENPIDKLAALTTALVAMLEYCSKAFDNASSIYVKPPASLDSLIDDIALSTQYSKHLAKVQSLFETHAREFDSGANPFDPNSWNRLLHGIETAEKLAKAFKVNPTLIKLVCTPGQFRLKELKEATNRTEGLFRSAMKDLAEITACVELNQPGRDGKDIGKLTWSEIRDRSLQASGEYSSIRDRIGLLLNVLKPGQSVPYARLPKDAEDVRQALELMRLKSEAAKVLVSNSVDLDSVANDESLEKARWVVDAPDHLLNSKLAMEIAISEEFRSEASKVFAEFTEKYEGMREPWGFIREIFDERRPFRDGKSIASIPLVTLSETLEELVGNIGSLDEWIKFQSWRRGLSQVGLQSCADELLAGAYSPGDACGAILANFYQRLFDHFVMSVPELREFDGEKHDQTRRQFQTLDEWEVKAAATQVREALLSRGDRPRIGWEVPTTSELGLLKKETEKKRRHMPLRKLFSEVPSVLQRLKPCIMMSPLSVSTFLTTEAIRFDLVIFDEASQVFPWDAIGSIYRGRQLIVAGDDKQLPPTSFFSRADIESDEEEDDIGDFESILSLCKSANMPSKGLRWHYRSRREPLIAFSNKHFYAGDLVTFPSAFDALADSVRLVQVPEGRWIDRKNLPEARKVAELVIDHHRKKPGKSLGVIAFNATQQQAIEDAIYEMRQASREVDTLLNSAIHEPLFVKNLENVQGDERDCILLSFAYGNNENGRFIKNFGPLSKPGGERRLNVAVTRAREQIILVASVRSSDMDLADSKSTGAQLLKSYLEFAEHGAGVLGNTGPGFSPFSESQIEKEIELALVENGMKPATQVGCGSYRIDLAIRHPDRPDFYCMGVECDGMPYQSANTARDRERIRQATLRNLGWNNIRVWALDWVRNPGAELKKIVAKYQQTLSLPISELAAPPVKEEPEFDDLQPSFASDSGPSKIYYLKIDDVPESEIGAAAIRVLTRAGTVEWQDLVTTLARELGFLRTGKKIQERLDTALFLLIEKGKINRNGNRVSLPKPD